MPMSRTLCALALVAACATGGRVVSAGAPADAPRQNRLIDKLARGVPALGTVNRRAPDSSDTVRALADTDLDFVVFDVEGGVKDMTQFAASLAALAESAARRPARGPIAPLVRIPKTSNGSPEDTVRRFIGLGARGVVFGHIDTPAAAARAVAAVVDALPAGRRTDGAGASRERGTWPLARESDIVAVMMIESPEAVANAAAIAAVPGVTALFFGPGDFSRSIGQPARLPDLHPEAEAAVQAMLAACQATRVVCGYPAAARDAAALAAEAQRRLQQGFRFVTQVNLTEF